MLCPLILGITLWVELCLIQIVILTNVHPHKRWSISIIELVISELQTIGIAELQSPHELYSRFKYIPFLHSVTDKFQMTGKAGNGDKWAPVPTVSCSLTIWGTNILKRVKHINVYMFSITIITLSEKRLRQNMWSEVAFVAQPKVCDEIIGHSFL